MTTSDTPDYEKVTREVINRAIDAEVSLALAKRDIEALTLKNDELLAKVTNYQLMMMREEKRLPRLRNKVKKGHTNEKSK